MNILQVAASVSRDDGGPAEAMLQLNDVFQRLGNQAVLLSTDAGAPRRSPWRSSFTVSSGAGLHLHREHAPHSLKASIGLLQELLRSAHQYDVMHVHGLYLAHNVAAHVAARRANTPYLVQLHGVLEPYQRRQSRRRKALYDRLAGYRILGGASRVIVASASEAVAAAEVLPDGAQVSVVPLGAAPPLPVAECHPPDGWDVSDDFPVVLFLGRLARKKQPQLLLDAWARTSVPAMLVLIGPDDDFTAAELEARARDLGITHRVRVLPPVAGPTKSWVLRRSDLFVLPSLNENFAIAVAEALMHGTAVLTTDAVSAGGYVAQCGAGRVVASADLTADELARHLQELVSEAALLLRMGQVGARFAAEHLTWERTAERLLAVYDEVLEERR